MTAALDFLQQQGERIADDGDPEHAHMIAVTDLCHALLNANEFLYLE